MRRNPACYSSKGELYRALMDVPQNQAVIAEVLGGRPGAAEGAGANFDALNVRYDLKGRRRVKDWPSAVRAATRGRPCWAALDFTALQEVVQDNDPTGGARLVLPAEAVDTPRRRRRAPTAPAPMSEAEAHAADRIPLTFDQVLAEMRERPEEYPFLSRNLVYAEAWRNLRAFLDTLSPSERAEFLFTLDPRELTGRSRSRAARSMRDRLLALNPATGDFLYDDVEQEDEPMRMNPEAVVMVENPKRRRRRASRRRAPARRRRRNPSTALVANYGPPAKRRRNPSMRGMMSTVREMVPAAGGGAAAGLVGAWGTGYFKRKRLEEAKRASDADEARELRQNPSFGEVFTPIGTGVGMALLASMFSRTPAARNFGAGAVGAGIGVAIDRAFLDEVDEELEKDGLLGVLVTEDELGVLVKEELGKMRPQLEAEIRESMRAGEGNDDDDGYDDDDDDGYDDDDDDDDAYYEDD